MFKMSVDLSKADVEITFKSGNLYLRAWIWP